MAVQLDTPWAGTTYNPPAPAGIAAIEAAIVAQLKASFATVAGMGGIDIEHFPDAPQKYRAVSQLGTVLVVYRDDDYKDPEPTDRIVQERVLQFEIDVISRSLGWAYASGDPSGPGAYQMLGQIRQALMGYAIPGCKKMYPRRTRFVEDAEGVNYIYAMDWEIPTMAVEVSTVDNYPVLTKVMALEENAQTTISVPAIDYTFNAQDQIQLPDQNISSVVVKSQDGSITYSLNIDYSVDAVNGVITNLGGASLIPAGATVSVGYSKADVVTAIAGGGNAPTWPTN